MRDVTVTVHDVPGPRDGRLLDDLAALFVTVDAAYAPGCWWTEVRAGGPAVARALVDRRWWATAAAHDRAGGLVAFAGLDAPVDAEIELMRVMTHPRHQGEGLGAEIVAALCALAGTAGLGVWCSVLADAPALPWYARFGFVPAGALRTSSGRPCVLLRRPRT